MNNALDPSWRRRIALDRQLLLGLRGRLQRAAPASRLRQDQQRLDNLDLRLARAMRGLLGRHDSPGCARGHAICTATVRRSVCDCFSNDSPACPSVSGALDTSGGQQRHDRLAALVRQLNAVSPLATLQQAMRCCAAAMMEKWSPMRPMSRSAMHCRALLVDGALELTVSAVRVSNDPETDS